MTIANHNTAQILLIGPAAGSSELCHSAFRCSLGGLATGVGIYFVIDDENVEVFRRCHDMVQTTITDIICPAIAADDPDGLLADVFFVSQEISHFFARFTCKLCFFQFGNQICADLFRRFAFIMAAIGVEPFLDSRFERTFIDETSQCFEMVLYIFPLLMESQVHAETKFAIIFKQGVRPNRPFAVLIFCPRDARKCSSPRLHTASRRSDIEAVAIQLGQQFDIRCFAAACAGAGEFQIRQFELAAFDTEFIEARIFDADRLGIVPVCRFFALGIERCKGECLYRTGLNAGTAAVAIERRYLNAEFIFFKAFADGFLRHEAFGSCFYFTFIEEIRTDSGMRADHRALVALYAFRYIPDRDIGCNATFFISRAAYGVIAVCIRQEFADRQVVAFLQIGRNTDSLDKIRQIFCHIFDGFVFRRSPCFRNLDFNNTGYAAFNGFTVHIDNLFALGRIGIDDGFFHIFDGIIDRNNIGQFEEGSLQNRIGTVAQTYFSGNLRRIDGVEFNMFIGNLTFYAGFQVCFKGCLIPAAVEEEDAAIFNFTDDIVIFDIRFFMTCYEVSRFDIIGRTNRAVAETQMGFRNAAGFLRIIFEISLNVLVRIIADNLDRVLVGTNCTIGTEAPELAADDSVRLDIHRYERNRQIGYIIIDADGEMLFRIITHEMNKYRFDMGRRNVLGGQAITAGNNHRITVRILECRTYIFIQRFANCTRFLRAVQDSNAFNRLRHSCKEVFQRERTIEVYLYIADFLAFCHHGINAFFNSARYGTHGYNDVFCIGSAVVVEQFIGPACKFTDFVHVILDDIRQFVIIGVDGFTVLEENIRVINAAAHGRMIRVQCFMFEFIEGIAVQQFI